MGEDLHATACYANRSERWDSSPLSPCGRGVGGEGLLLSALPRNTHCHLVIAFAIVCLPVVAPVVAGEPAPLIRAHAHNDYEHKRPLFDALDQGLCSVEADIFLVDGQLLVGHTRRSLKPERTLASLYLVPLKERVAKNGGRVYRGGPEFTLLIDFKTKGEPTYAVLKNDAREVRGPN